MRPDSSHGHVGSAGRRRRIRRRGCRCGTRGVYQHCSEKHLSRYADEFAFRHNTRVKLGFNDKDRAELIAKSAARKRLTYRRTDGAHVSLQGGALRPLEGEERKPNADLMVIGGRVVT